MQDNQQQNQAFKLVQNQQQMEELQNGINNNSFKQQQQSSKQQQQQYQDNDNSNNNKNNGGCLYNNNEQKFMKIIKDTDKNMYYMNWNVLQYENQNGNNDNELQRLVWSLFESNGWLDTYKIKIKQFCVFLNSLESKYNKKNNPFHNFTHGVAVMQCCFSLCQSEQVQKYLNNFDIFCMTFSGLCHDVSHPAHTNIFAVNSMSKLSIRYNDESPLEQHHTATTFKLMQRYNLLEEMPQEQFKQMRKKIISNILYTDNSKHQELMQKFAKIQSLEQFGKQEEDLEILQGMIIHTADFTGGAQPFENAKLWSYRVNQEFAQQYENEGKLGLVQTPFMKDLDKVHIMAKAEIGFFKFLVIPLWTQMNQFLNGYIEENVNNLQQNIENWQIVHDQNKPK